MIHWKPIGEYVEPNWVQLGTDMPPVLFWRPKKGATLGYIRDGELFDAKWVYVCDSHKLSDFSTINGPGDNSVDLDLIEPKPDVATTNRDEAIKLAILPTSAQSD
jgi:hypothetical protein